MNNMIFKIIKTEGIKILFPMIINGIHYLFCKYILRQNFIIKNIHRSKMQLNLKDNGIARALAILGTREKEHIYILDKILKGNENILDVGANIGYYTLLMARRVPSGKVYAIEPCPVNYINLVDNIQLNAYDNILFYNLGMSDKKGNAKMYLSKLSNVHTMLPKDVTNQMSGKSIQIQTTTPSNFINKLQPIHLLRMDIEGYETKVLKDIADNCKVYPKILFEVHAGKYNEENNLNKQLEKLFKLGYYFKYMASGQRDTFLHNGYSYIEKIPTDGTIRYIYENVKNEDALKLVNKCRTVLMVRREEKIKKENKEEISFCSLNGDTYLGDK